MTGESDANVCMKRIAAEQEAFIDVGTIHDMFWVGEMHEARDLMNSLLRMKVNKEHPHAWLAEARLQKGGKYRPNQVGYWWLLGGLIEHHRRGVLHSKENKA